MSKLKPSNQKKASQSPQTKEIREKIQQLEKQIQNQIIKLQELRGNCLCFPLLIGEASLTHSVVDDTYDQLRKQYAHCNGKLDVLVDSGGGDLDAAYNLANLFRRFGMEELNFIIPRWAKSAATLLVCSGDTILMTPVAELGPLDPQITEFNPLEKRLEQFSPLHIEATLELIRQEFQKGSEQLAKGLMERLQFPLTLGSFTKSLDIAVQYLVKLLSTRMLKADTSQTTAHSIANTLTKGYADHGFSINSHEARSIGLNVIDLDGEQLDCVWEIHKFNRERRSLERKLRQGKLSELLEGFPPELLDKLPATLQEQLKS